MNAIDRLIEAIETTGNPTALGLDTQLSHLPMGFYDYADDSIDEQCAAILAYNHKMLEAVKGLLPCVKVQVAYYEQMGPMGMYAFAQTLKAAREAGFFTIADVKRNDIGATSEAYANAYLRPGAGFEADMITVNGYLGVDGIAPFLKLCEDNGKGIFVLVKTSNPSSGQLQDLSVGEKTVFETMGDLVEQWGVSTEGKYGYSAVGAVVGATYPKQSVELRKRMPRTFFLVPGYGAQGATGADLAGCFDENGRGAVVNASRSLLTAHKKHPRLPWDVALRTEVLKMRGDIMDNLPNA